MHIQDVIDQYHALLTDEIAEEADHEMRAGMRERDLYFGDRPLCLVLRPHFYFESDWSFLKSGLERLLSAFARTHSICMENADYRALLHLDPYEEELFQLDRGGPVPWTSSRLDTFYVVDERSLKVVEYNAETPAGIGYGDKLAEVFDQLEPMRRIRERYAIECKPAMGSLHTALMNAYKRWGRTQTPQVAILDWQEVPTLNEHRITQVYFEAVGTRTILADPRELVYRSGQLWKDDFRIDLIYKRVLYSELIERMGMDNPVVKAIRDRAVFITNSPSAKLMAKKASLAFLSDEQQAHLFTLEERRAIDAHIPWTRVVAERKTMYGGQEIDMVAFIAENKHRLVLKPNDEYGGKGVVIGWVSSDEAWQEALKQALETPYVVQERVAIVERAFPIWAEGELSITPLYVDADPYVFSGGIVDGCLTRLSPVALLNVTAGAGSVVPTYIIRQR